MLSFAAVSNGMDSRPYKKAEQSKIGSDLSLVPKGNDPSNRVYPNNKQAEQSL